MGLFGGKKDDAQKGPGKDREKPTTARRSRRIVQPGAAKPAAAPGGTKARSPEPQVKRPPQARPAAKSPADEEVLQLDDFVDAPPPPPRRPGAPAPAPVNEVPDLDFQGDLNAATSADGPSRTGDAALLEFLIDKAQLISPEQAQGAQQLAYDQGLALDAALVRQGVITEEAMVSALTKECWVPHLKVDKYEIRKKALSTISVDDARRFGVLPVDKLGSILNLAMVNPLDEEAIRHLESKTGLEIKKVVASRSEIEGGIAKYFGGEGAAASIPDSDGSRMFSQDLPAAQGSATQQLAKASPPAARPPAPAPAAASEPAAMDDFMDIADIDDLLGDGDEVAPALIEPVALEPIDAPEPMLEPAAEWEPTSAGPSSEDIFQDLTDTSPIEPEPKLEPAKAEVEEVLDLEFQPEPAALAPEPQSSDGIFDDLADLEPVAPAKAPSAPAPAPAPAPAASASPRSPSRAATKSFRAKPSSLNAPATDVEDLLPVTEDEFQQSIAHGRVRVFEKWVGIQTRNRILNAVVVDEKLDPLLAGLRESAYKISA
ncbi:MAG: hypothetical protein EA402_11595 [Planctomycetota bacterium]|nr:MAG: hypothetical protein EA402_11595 [Planctomycetota bacterium]